MDDVHAHQRTGEEGTRASLWDNDNLPKDSSRQTLPVETKPCSNPPAHERRPLGKEMFANVVSGVFSGTSAALLVAPLEVVKTRLQAQAPGHNGPVHYKGIRDALRRMVAEEGPRSLYRGLGPTLFGLIPTWTIYWPTYQLVKSSLKDLEVVHRRQLENNPFVHLTAAISAGAITSLCTNPLWVVKTRLMVQHKSHTRYYKSTLDALVTITRTEGISGLYKGFSAGLLGLSHVAVQFPVYEYFRRKLMERNPNSENWVYNVGLASLLAKATASVITYPHEVLRTRLQNETTPPVKYFTVKQTALLIWKEERYKGLYRGLTTNLCRTIPAGVVTFVTYEETLKHVHIWQDQRLHNQQI